MTNSKNLYPIVETAQSKKFIGYTCGFMADHNEFKTYKLIKAEYNRLPDGSVEVSAVTGESLSPLRKMGTRVVSAEEFEDRPLDPYDSLEEARWALGLLNATI